MGCLNSDKNFKHWFGNIHFSGPCNRSCYFCIGQHMMTLDPLNNLDKGPLELKGMDEFIDALQLRGIKEINLTGSNTDPLLYHHLSELKGFLRHYIPDLKLGVRTNGVTALNHPEWNIFNKISISFPSFYKSIYRAMMNGDPPPLAKILEQTKVPVKINIVLGRQNCDWTHLSEMFGQLLDLGVTTVNLREPYGQPHIGDPLINSCLPLLINQDTFGMPTYMFGRMKITYWDVHYVEVESVNLYANGIVSTAYPITKGHDPKTGKVEDQSHFEIPGRIRPQWLGVKA